MDVDGAMMNGCCVSGSVNVPQNVYVSRWPSADTNGGLANGGLVTKKM